LGAGLLAILAAFLWDDAVTGACFRTSQGAVARAAQWLSHYGDWPKMLPAGLLTVAGLAAFRKFAAGRLLLLVLLAGLLTGLATIPVHCAFGRTRPSAPVPQGFYGFRCQSQWIIGKYQFSSFPSGHTAAWAGLAGVAWFRRRRWGVILLAAAVAVGWSRMALGCHHFSDVTAALVWGLAVGPWLGNWLEPGINGLWAKMGLPRA
jgi:membrane-associated phospholipid phosphatase